ncbi:MAG: hypothetical protein ACUZ8H_03955 [Candidatus Anammoxibacter sp.]
MRFRIYYFVFFFVFMIRDVFATHKAINSAREHFTKDTNTTWFIIVSVIAVIGIIVWLIINSAKESKKKK